MPPSTHSYGCAGNGTSRCSAPRGELDFRGVGHGVAWTPFLTWARSVRRGNATCGSGLQTIARCSRVIYELGVDVGGTQAESGRGGRQPLAGEFGAACLRFAHRGQIEGGCEHTRRIGITLNLVIGVDGVEQVRIQDQRVIEVRSLGAQLVTVDGLFADRGERRIAGQRSRGVVGRRRITAGVAQISHQIVAELLLDCDIADHRIRIAAALAVFNTRAVRPGS